MSFGVRLSIVGVAFVALFSVLPLRLWQIQVTAAEEYRERADTNLVAFVDTPAPRGEIRDVKGRLIAGTRPALAAVIEGARLPEGVALVSMIERLAAFTAMPASEIEHVLDDAKNQADRLTLISELTEDQAVFLVERDELFPGVSVVPQPVRVYETGELVPHVVGFIGRPDAADLETSGIGSTDVLGKAGVEREYDDVLRGEPGLIKYQVNAQGKILDTLGEQAPAAGGSLILEIDLDLQAVLNDSLLEGLDLARESYAPGGCTSGEEDPGCPVRAVGIVLNATNGAVAAMASVPGYDPNIFVGGVTQTELDAFPEGAFNNFAIQGEYAPASTFKAVTYVTAFEADLVPREATSLEDEIECTAALRADFQDESQKVFRNWTRADDGLQDIHRAFIRSCNIYFWDLALNLWKQSKNTARENVLQDWSRALGLGAQTNIDLPFERSGIIPDRELFQEWKLAEDPRLDSARRDLASPWLGGDLLQAAVGQGSVLVTPLQLATAFAAMVNGGTVWQPRVLNQVIDSDGVQLLDNSKKAINRIEMSPRTVLQLRRDLQQVVNSPEGTAFRAFADFGEGKDQVGGKTGTAQVIREREPDDGPKIEAVSTALFVGVAPIDNPEWVVVVIIERGGSGGGDAAPVAKPVLQFLLSGADAVTPVLAELQDFD